MTKIDVTSIMNLTPHALHIEFGEAKLEIPASGQVARCSQKEEVIAELYYEVAMKNETEIKKECLIIPITKLELGEVQGLPAPKKGTIFCVSRVVADAVKGERNDVIIPGPAIRDKDGKIIGAKGFSFV